MHKAILAQAKYRNAEALKKFYMEVLESFTQQLEKQCRYRANISDDDIDQLKKLVIKKLQFTTNSKVNDEHFQKYLSMRQFTPQIIQVKIKEDTDKQETPMKERKEYSQPQTEQATKMEKKVDDKKEENESDSSQDDLAVYEGNNCIFHFPTDIPKEPQIEPYMQRIKVQPQPEEPESLNLKQQALSFLPELESDSQSDYQSFLRAVQKGIGTALLGTFSSWKIKRTPKDQKIHLELNDVFVKYMNLPFENYYPRVLCQLSKQDRDSLPEQYRK